MTTKEKQRAADLFDSRRWVRMANAYEQRLQELGVDQLRSPRLDGMPRSGNFGGCLADRVALIQTVKGAAAHARAKADKAKKRAERHLTSLEETEAMFARAYYIDGLSMEAAAKVIDRSVRQCLRYQRKIFGSVGLTALRDNTGTEQDG